MSMSSMWLEVIFSLLNETKIDDDDDLVWIIGEQKIAKKKTSSETKREQNKNANREKRSAREIRIHWN